MNAMPPEPDFPVQPFPVQGDMGMTAEQSGSPPVQQGTGRRLPRWLNVIRLITGVLWGAVALVTAAGGVAELTIHNVGGAVVCFVVAVGSGWYDYRVWKGRARRLLI
jgi:hypothetical protein